MTISVKWIQWLSVQNGYNDSVQRGHTNYQCKMDTRTIAQKGHIDSCQLQLLVLIAKVKLHSHLVSIYTDCWLTFCHYRYLCPFCPGSQLVPLALIAIWSVLLWQPLDLFCPVSQLVPFALITSWSILCW